MSRFKIGQRWTSDMEPDLGLGMVIHVDNRTVQIHFSASECVRQYAVTSAPLRRVQFGNGDTIRSMDGRQHVVTEKVDVDNLIVYVTEDGDIPEDQLCDTLSFSTPKDRLLNNIFDSNRAFDLRLQTLENDCAWRKSPVRGFIGGRIDLIPHQLYVASEVAGRPVPRVLLSDEVGLGKTIEAGLILHRLLICGRIQRVLLLVPESLVHQWFIELLRKFNLYFKLIDRSHVTGKKEEDEETDHNPFDEDQLFIVNIEWLAREKTWQQVAQHSEWDLLIVDEAHHLTENSGEYKLVKRLSAKTPGLILITATPQQLGYKSHFNRLQLLDPHRFHDFNDFEKEADQYSKTAGLINRLLDNGSFEKDEIKGWNQVFPDISLPKNQNAREAVIRDLLDRHGMGRIMFRNTRASMKGFPQREVEMIKLRGSVENCQALDQEFHADFSRKAHRVEFEYSRDPRCEWLTNWLKENPNQKILLICRSIEKVKAIDEALRKMINVRSALFHENLSLIQRDKNAAWFAQKKGARILLCSEIGSEGRNFQFVHHLFLFDLPLDPERLEQRIGRLDRIGQTETIYIHVPVIENTPQAILAHWYHEGLDAFQGSVTGAYEISKSLGHRVQEVARSLSGLTELIHETKVESTRLSGQLETGRDRLLELHSMDDAASKALVNAITEMDKDQQLDHFTANLLNQFGIQSDTVSHRTIRIDDSLLDDPAFPMPKFKEGAWTATFDRYRAIHHEDIEFLTQDHPMITGAMERYLGSEKGNASATMWPGAPTEEILLEAVFVLECVAPPRLHVDRFLPPTPIHVCVNQSGQDRTALLDQKGFSSSLRGSPPGELTSNAKVKKHIPEMIDHCHAFATLKIQPIIDIGLTDAEKTLDRELSRLNHLKKLNPNIRDEEIEIIQTEKKELTKCIQSARLRLDALRLIFATS